MTVFVVVGIVLIFYVGYQLYRLLFPSPNINPHGKYVLISGCDSGFGHALAIDLDRQGFNVFAGIYTPDNEERIKGQLSQRATVILLDITDQNDIDAAYDIVSKKTKTLHALVNNAGIARGGFIDWTPVDFFREIMEVNFFGQITMIKKFLPLLISARGSRVVNVCSVAGFLTGPSISAYASSKFAFEAFSDTLRREMHAWGLHVSIVEPGFMRTPSIEGIEHAYLSLWTSLEDSVRKRWGEDFFNGMIKQIEKDPFLLNAENPQKVVRVLRHAVMNTAPRIRYRPGWQSSLFFFPLSMLPAWLVDLILIKTIHAHSLPAGVTEQKS